jgi:hypothetical protein
MRTITHEIATLDYVALLSDPWLRPVPEQLCAPAGHVWSCRMTGGCT